MKKEKIIPALHEVDEPVLAQGPTEEEKLAELAKIEAEEEAESKAFDEPELDEGVEAMSDEELNIAKKELPVKAVKKPVTQKVVAVKKTELKPRHERENIIATKTMLYSYPTPKQWEEIHKIQPERIVFYFTMTKHEYKELFLCQVKYRTKIIGSTGARVY